MLICSLVCLPPFSLAESEFYYTHLKAALRLFCNTKIVLGIRVIRLFTSTVSCPISGHFLQNCNILPQNSTNVLKFSHNVASTVASTAGREVSSLEALWFLCSYGKSRSNSVP